MAKMIGRHFTMEVSTGGVTYTTVGEVNTDSLDVNNDLADSTTNDSGGAKEEMYADSQTSGEVSGKYDSGNAGQILVMAAALNKTQLYCRFRPRTASGEKQFVFLANLANWKTSGSTGDVREFSVSVRSTGAVTYSGQ